MTNREVMQQALEALCSAVEPKKGKVYAREFELIDCYAMHEQAITALREALAQPEQEPVAFYHPHKGFYWAKPTHIAAPTVVDVPPVPLYVKWKAAQRPWQGLTEEDWVKIGDMPDTWDQGAAWAAARLKEKNGY